jgi:hypothetical protein
VLGPAPLPTSLLAPEVPEESTLVSVIRAAGELGADAKPAAGALRALARDVDPDVRAAAAEALKKIE